MRVSVDMRRFGAFRIAEALGCRVPDALFVGGLPAALGVVRFGLMPNTGIPLRRRLLAAAGVAVTGTLLGWSLLVLTR